MTRNQYREMAGRICTCLMALEDKPELQRGAILMALMISDVIEQDGKMGQRTFLRSCGIEPGKKRGRRLELHLDEAHQTYLYGDSVVDEGPLRPAQLSQ